MGRIAENPALRQSQKCSARTSGRCHPFPANPYVTSERLAVTVGKTPYVRFDLNDYTVPHTQVRKTLTVVADPERVRVLDGPLTVAAHPRCYDQGAQIE